MLDLVVPTPQHLRRAIAAIDIQRRSGATVWVCCALGFSRSAASIVGWLRLHGERGATIDDDAEALVRRVRPQTVLRAAWRCAIDRAAPARPSGAAPINALQDRMP